MDRLRRIRQRLVRVQGDVEQIVAEVDLAGLEEDAAKAKAQERLKALEVALRRRNIQT